MTKHYLRILYAILILEIFLISPISTQDVNSSTASTSSSNPYNQNFKVKAGDSMTYQYNNVYNNGYNYIEEAVTLSDSSFVNFNITHGMDFTVKVFSSSSNSAETQITYNIPNKSQIITKPSIYTVPYLTQGFDNFSIASQYVHDTSVNNPNNQISISGDYITEITNATSSQTTIIFNWRNGWLKSYDSVGYLSNGTRNYELSFAQVNNSNIDINLIFIVIAIAIFPIFFILGILLARRFKKNKK